MGKRRHAHVREVARSTPETDQQQGTKIYLMVAASSPCVSFTLSCVLFALP
jgi:hypothetical protein